MKKRTYVIISFLAILTLVIAFVIFYISMNRPSTEMYIDPQTIPGIAGQDFPVDVRIANVDNLYGWQLKLRWNTTVLRLVNATEGTFLKSHGNTFFNPAINETGTIVLYGTLLGDVPGVNGSGVLTTLWFHVKESGESDLHLYDTLLVNSYDQIITHTARDGRFSS